MSRRFLVERKLRQIAININNDCPFCYSYFENINHDICNISQKKMIYKFTLFFQLLYFYSVQVGFNIFGTVGIMTYNIPSSVGGNIFMSQIYIIA